MDFVFVFSIRRQLKAWVAYWPGHSLNSYFFRAHAKIINHFIFMRVWLGYYQSFVISLIAIDLAAIVVFFFSSPSRFVMVGRGLCFSNNHIKTKATAQVE
jgi:hypothetical protein